MAAKQTRNYPYNGCQWEYVKSCWHKTVWHCYWWYSHCLFSVVSNHLLECPSGYLIQKNAYETNPLLVSKKHLIVNKLCHELKKSNLFERVIARVSCSTGFPSYTFFFWSQTADLEAFLYCTLHWQPDIDWFFSNTFE